MALIGTLRAKMTKLVVGAIAISMGAFIVGTDLFGSGPRSMFGGSDRDVGTIAGHDISLEEYNAEILARENMYIRNFGRTPGDRERPTLQNQAWEMLIARNAIQPQYGMVGVKVTTDELRDMVWGKNVDENIKSAFLDSAGRFDRNRLLTYLKTVDELPRNSPDRLNWEAFQEDLRASRERIKYENLIIKTAYVTEAEAEQDYHNQNDVAEVKYLYVPYSAISDSAITVTDADLQNYYDKNKERYKVEHTRSLKYVSFPVIPSSEDSLAVTSEMSRLAAEFKNVKDDSLFASTNTDGGSAFTKYTMASLPTILNNQKQNVVEGAVIGPVLDGSQYKLFKITRIGKDTVYNARARHILIKWENTTPEAKKAAKEKARKILADIRKGASFSDKAREFGTDGTATRGGDLGWFGKGGMVKQFETPVFAATKPGLLADVVETEFGYHIIDVTNVKDNTAYWVAYIERNIIASDETMNVAIRKADEFKGKVSDVEEFEAEAKKEGLSIFEANDLGTGERRINNLGEARQIITWLFRDASIGKVSDVFDVTDNYVVAVMTGEVPKGYKAFSMVKDDIRPLARNQVAGRFITDKLKGKTEALEELAKQFGSEASVYTMNDLKPSGNQMTGVGFDPAVVGAVFSLENGKRSAPLTGESGVALVDLQNKTIAPPMGDFSLFKNQLLQNVSGRGGYYITEALREAAKVEDQRYKFF